MRNLINVTSLILGCDIVEELKLRKKILPDYPDSAKHTLVNSTGECPFGFNPYIYPLKIFKTKLDIKGITWNDMGYYVCIWTTGELLLVLNPKDRDIYDDRVGISVFQYGLDENDVKELGNEPIFAPKSEWLEEESHMVLLEYLDKFSATLNDTIHRLVSESTISYNGKECK